MLFIHFFMLTCTVQILVAGLHISLISYEILRFFPKADYKSPMIFFNKVYQISHQQDNIYVCYKALYYGQNHNHCSINELQNISVRFGCIKSGV